MRKITTQITLMLVLLSFGCEQDSTPIEEENLTETRQTQPITKSDIQELEFADYGLSRESQQAVEDWLKYIELSENIEKIKKGNLGFIQGDQQLLQTFLDDLRNTIPASVNTLSVKSRLLVLETKLLNAQNLVKLRNVPKNKKLEGIREVLVAMSNFNDQMNKKFEIESNNILRPEPRTND